MDQLSNFCRHRGGFQLLDLIIPELKSHVIPYKFKCSHWWKIHFFLHLFSTLWFNSVHVWFVTENQMIQIDTDKNAVDFCLFLWLFKLLQDVLPNLLLLFFSYPLKSGIFIGLFNGCGQKKQVAYLLLRNYLTTFFGWLPCFSSLTYRISLCWLPELNTWVI